MKREKPFYLILVFQSSVCSALDVKEEEKNKSRREKVRHAMTKSVHFSFTYQ